MLLLLALTWTHLLTPVLASSPAAAYIVPLEMRSGAMRSRSWSSSGSSNSRHLLGAGKVQVMGR